MTKGELYDLKYMLSDFIYPRLKEFKEKVDSKNAPSIPDFSNVEHFSNQTSFAEKEKYWSEILSKMIIPFEYHVDPEKFKHLDFEEINEKVELGLKLFAEYFTNLWF
ncbi:hypothetical protein ASG31_11340 [Chryseobacterium sp. Leaf404]|uniref:hypothetical protein n=1 Tax=unclassified Chryseobacterium TaxID=2593645 RepID=UPI0006FE22C5|nr:MULTISPECIES: hypothetical protein [unclassified Chryseobacterium]KQT16952.1 hypothetical protein ASG31_11340 [Chryseobacterium sp. Leaf404]